MEEKEENSLSTPVLPTQSLALYSNRHLYESQWKFTNLPLEIIAKILSYLSFLNKSAFKLHVSFEPLEQTIQNVRLTCQHWNEAILIDSNSQLFNYYMHNKNLFYQAFSTNVKIPKLIEFDVINGRQIFKKGLPALIQNKNSIQSFYCSHLNARRIKRNVIHLFQFSVYHRHMAVVTVTYLLLLLFFGMLFVQDVFISIFGSIIMNTYIRYFYNIIFLPLYFILLVFFVVVLLVNLFHGSNDKPCGTEVRIAILTLGGASIFCGLVASTLFMIQLNIAMLPLSITPSQFGRIEMIPWPIVFIPWYILLSGFALLCFGYLIYIIINKFMRWSNSDIYAFSVMLFLLLETLLCLVLVIWIGIALEFPFIIQSAYIFIPAYVMEFLFFVFIFCNCYFEMKEIFNHDLKKCAWLRSLCLFGATLGMVLNHILCSLAWYHWIPLSVAYLEVMFPLTCFYVWTMLMLFPKRTPANAFKTYVTPPRNYKLDFKDNTWIWKLKQKD